MNTLAVLSLLLIVCCVLCFSWYFKFRLNIKSVEKESEISTKEFDSLCTPTRKFSDDEVRLFLDKNKVLITKIRKISSSVWFKDKTIIQNSSKLLDYYESILKYQNTNNELYNGIIYINDNISRLSKAQFALNEECVYQAHHKIERHRNLCRTLLQNLSLVSRNDCMKYVENSDLADSFSKEYLTTINAEHINMHNDNFVLLSKEANKVFFDTCLTYPLDEQQRDAILHLEDNNLIIASAGSGKTSTMVGKARYMVEVEKIDPTRVLIITYTRKAAGELSERLGIEGLSCFTFHALANKIIAEVTGHKPSICEPNFTLNCFYNILKKNEDFKSAINQYFLGMRSLMKLEHDYETAEEYYADRKKYGIQAMFKDMHGSMIFTKSEEERRICEWLSLHDVQFTYEESYEYETDSNRYKQYRPDFSVYFINKDGKNERLYFEHFAIDKKGNVPLWFGTDYNSSDQSDTAVVNRWRVANSEYINGIKWKQNLHKERKTNLIYTTSAMFHDNSVWNHLEQQLKSCGVHVHTLSPDELYQKLVQRDKSIERSIYKLIEQFVTLQKTNLVKIEELIKKARDNKDKRSEFIISEIMSPFITFYNKELLEKKYIDFTDAIIQATKLCKEGRWADYDYILVDEFQDISKDRYLFLNSLRKDNPDCFTKLFCVGDDWQSIYRFSGSDMTLFYDFEKYFGYTKHCKIETTYRFHNPLIKASSDFIQTNPNQVKKSIRDFFVKSDEYLFLENRYNSISKGPFINYDLEPSDIFEKKCDDAINSLKEDMEELTPKTDIELHEYSSDEDEKMQVEELIHQIPTNESILIIARYNYDSKSLGFQFTPHDADKKVIWLNLAERRIRFMSVHGSKGLEADHVILINCNRGINGFPSLIEDDPVLAFVLSDKDIFENAEERRVFYVAITRAKKRTHIFYNDRTPSCFVDELKGTDSENTYKYMPCPTCGNGHIIPIKEGSNTYHGDWVALACTNKTGGCPYFQLMNRSEYLHKLNEFNERNSISPVQEYSKSIASRIKDCFKTVQQKEELEKLIKNLNSIHFDSIIRENYNIKRP